MQGISSIGGDISKMYGGASSQADKARFDSKAKSAENSELRSTFDAFVGEVFFTQMMESMRKTTGKPAYMHGGRGEEVFQKQLDQVFSQEMTKASASSFSEPMFELFTLNRS